MTFLIKNALATVNSAAGKLFAFECQIDYPVDFYEALIRIFTPNVSVAKQLLKEKRSILAKKCAEWNQNKVELYWSSTEKPISIHSENTPEKSSILNSTKPLIRSVISAKIELDFNAIYKSQNPIYITQLCDQTNLFANNAALAAQGKKPKEFLGQSASALNDEEELALRCSLIYKDGSLTEYQYSALRWFCDPETRFWRRKRMNFTSNFRRIEYLGELCWLGEVLEAVETGTVVV